MKNLLAATTMLLLLAAAAPARAKVCYKCTEYRPARYVCASRDTFRARRAARKVCHWRSYTSTCHCWRWVRPKHRDLLQWALRHLAPPRR